MRVCCAALCVYAWTGELTPFQGEVFAAASARANQSQGQDASVARVEKGYTLSSMEVIGDVEAIDSDQARLELKFNVKLFSPDVQAIPLRFVNCLLSTDPEFSSPQVGQVLDFDSEQGGFLWLIEDPSASLANIKEHTLLLQVTTEIGRAKDRSEIKFQLPEAFSSEIRLRVPYENASAVTSSGSVPEVEYTADGSTIRVESMDGQVSLLWWQPSDTAAAEWPLIEGDISTLLDPVQQLVRHEARFTVEGPVSAGDALRVRIPRGFDVISPTPSRRNDSKTGLGKNGSVVEIELKENEPARLVLESRVLDFSDLEIQPLVPEQTARHTGTWKFSCPDGWLVMPRIIPSGVEQVEYESIDANAGATLPHTDEIGVAFRYWAQSMPLRLRAFRPRTIVTGQILHSVSVDPTHLRLNGTFDLNISSGQLRALELSLHDWIVEEIRIDDDETLLQGNVDETGLWYLPLSRPLTGRVQMQIIASARLAEPATLNFSLPTLLHTNTRGDALEIIVPQDWECLPTSHEIQRLTNIEGFTGPGLRYNVQGPDAQFVGTIRPFPSYSLRSEVSVTFNTDGIQVRQELHTLAPVSELSALRLLVPAPLWENRAANSLEFTLDGKPIGVARSSRDDPQLGRNTAVVVSISAQALAELRASTSDERRIGITHSIDRTNQPQRKLRELIHLLVPTNAGFAGHSVTLDVANSLIVKLSDTASPWVKSETVVDGISSPAYETSSSESFIELTVSDNTKPSTATAVIRDLVIQSWLGPEFREDRVMFVWHSDSASEEFTITLPEGSASQYVLRQNKAMLQNYAVGSDRQITVRSSETSPSESSGKATIPIELVYRIPGDHTGAIDLPPPVFTEEVQILNTYWHLTMPAAQHLIWTGDEYQSDNTWNWSGGWKRKPARSLNSLEARVQAISSPAIPSGVNRYLFCGVGPPASLRLISGRRSMIVGLSSLATLALGIAFLRYARIRTPSFVLVVLIAIVGLAWSFPSTAPLFLQAAALGLLLFLAAAAIRRLVDQEKTPARLAAERDDSRSAHSKLRNRESGAATEVHAVPKPTS
ncbi:MAG: hypothetical protein MPJ50_00590 [Pirellulales bacterium]|nr:hypothetical protein [Pirellulales bacterium]